MAKCKERRSCRKAGHPNVLFRYAAERAVSIDMITRGGDPAPLNLRSRAPLWRVANISSRTSKVWPPFCAYRMNLPPFFRSMAQDDDGHVTRE
jgi:hypothetical protein